MTRRAVRVLQAMLPLVCAMFFSSLTTAQTWNLRWSDEFNGAANTFPDGSNWRFEYGNLHVNNELEFYCGPPGDTSNHAPCTNNSNVFMDGNGHLVIQAIRVGSGTGPGSNSWTSTRMVSRGMQSFTYGRIEASMKLPTGAGLWPAFWALGTNISSVGWPSSGEIDFMENVPSPPGNLGPAKISSTLHGGKAFGNCYCGGNGLSGIFTFANSDVSSFHTYGGIWSPYMVQFYVDDPANVFEVRTANNIPASQVWDFNHPFYLLLNLAVGGTGSWPGPPDNNTPSPASMLVDYVRYYQAAAAPPSLGTANSITVKAGATSGSTTTINLSGVAADGRVYLNCSTNAPKSSCAIATADPLNKYTVNFSVSRTAMATVALTTTNNSGNGSGGSAGTPPGNYRVTVNAYAETNASTANPPVPDASMQIPVTVR
ncbi:MAG TPA: glycoside hydrolase family 16 protein [Terriglobales bacterium]|nr:glycoside hydrolase family 16 protein [Terriglobales bacterium]